MKKSILNSNGAVLQMKITGLGQSPESITPKLFTVKSCEPALLSNIWFAKIVSEYDQDIPQSQTADNPMAPRGRATQPSRDTKTTN